MKDKVVICLLIALGILFEVFPDVSAQDAAGKAQQLLAQARAAIGGEKLKSLQSLSAEGNYRRTMGGMEMSGELTIEMVMPDKMIKIETMRPFGDLEINRLEAVNGETVWEDQQSSGGGGNVILRRGGRNLDPKKAEEMMKSMVRAEFARTTLGLLLNTTSTFPVEYAYAGEAEAPEGKADVLTVKGENNFAARLFLDQKTHRPLMLTYMGRKPRIVTSMSTDGAASKRDVEEKLKEVEAAAAAAAEVEYQVRFLDYKDVNGILLPHRISKGIESETNEEIEFTKFKINPQIKPEKFVKK